MFILMLIILDATTVCLIGSFLNSDGLEFVNPFWIYKRIKVNWFGSALVSLLFNMITLPFAICYWLYKLCTAGRKDGFNEQ